MRRVRPSYSSNALGAPLNIIRASCNTAAAILEKKYIRSIKDTLLRFYFSYISANISLIERGQIEEFYSINIENSLNTFISKRFEAISMEFLEAHLGLNITKG